MQTKRRRFLRRFDWHDNARIAARILRTARKTLAGSEIRELERVAAGCGPRTLHIKTTTRDGKPTIVRDTPFIRIVTEFAHLL